MLITVKSEGYARTIPANLVADIVLCASGESHSDALKAVSEALQNLVESFTMADLGVVDQVGNSEVKEAESGYCASIPIKKVVTGSNPLVAEVLSNLLSQKNYIASIRTYYELDEDQISGLTTVCIRNCQLHAKQRAEAIYKNELGSSEDIELTTKLVNAKLGNLNFLTSNVGNNLFRSTDVCVSIRGEFIYDVVYSAVLAEDSVYDAMFEQLDMGDAFHQIDSSWENTGFNKDAETRSCTELVEDGSDTSDIGSKSVGIADLNI